MRHIPIPGEDVRSIFIHPHQECTTSPEIGCASPEIHIPHGNEDVPHQECISSLGMEMCFTGNGDVPHCECISSPGMYILKGWGCASLGIHILTGNGDVPHQECTSSPGLGMCLTVNAYPHQECTSSTGIWMCFTVNAHPHRECREWGCASL